MSTSAIYYLPAAPTGSGSTTPAPRTLTRNQVAASDVLFEPTEDGGELRFVGGEPLRSDGLVAAAYLSLFGGNDDDAGLTSTRNKQWWGNFSEQNPARWLRSETQYLLATLPPTTGNLRRIESAAKNDLAWLLSERVGSDLQVRATMPARNRIDLDVVLTIAPGAVERFNFPRSWGT